MEDIRYLDVPFDERYDATNMGAKYDSKRKTWYVDSNANNADMVIERYGSEDFSYQRWIEDGRNKRIRPFIPAKTQFKPHPHQVEDGRLILKAWEQGRQGFLIASGTGVGKTLSMIVGACNIAKKAGYNPVKRMKVLIVCPKSVIPSWRNTLKAYAAESLMLRVMIINYQQLNKLIKPPATAKSAKTTRIKNRRTARGGTPKIDFNVIIFDEEQYLKNYPSSAVSMAANTIAGMDTAYKKGEKPFVISGTATPGTNPLELSMLAPWLASLVNNASRKYISPSSWGAFLMENGFHVKKGKTGWAWSQAPWWNSNGDKSAQQAASNKIRKEHEEDVNRIGEALARPDAPYVQRKPSDIAGWPTQQAIELPMDIGIKGMTAYMLAWTQFRTALKLAAAKNDSKSPLVEALRFRQKASLLKADGIAEFTVENVKAGNQVFIGCEFMETIDMIEEKLKKARIPYAEYSGRNESNREQERLRFQRGEALVVLCTTVAGVSFHAGEKLPDGSIASTANRITILADVRNRVLDTMQQMGRCHRDGQNSICYIPYAEKTVDEKVIGTFIDKIGNMKAMLADDSNDFLNDLLGVIA